MKRMRREDAVKLAALADRAIKKDMKEAVTDKQPISKTEREVIRRARNAAGRKVGHDGDWL